MDAWVDGHAYMGVWLCVAVCGWVWVCVGVFVNIPCHFLQEKILESSFWK